MPQKRVVAVIGTCDTKLEAMLFIKDSINSSDSCRAILIDIGTYDPPDSPGIDVSRQDLAGHLDSTPPKSRDEAASRMTEHLTRKIRDLFAKESIHGVIAAGGSGNTSVCASAFRVALPIGFPKLIVSTMASGDVSHYVGETDLTMMYSVVDVAGMNDILRVVLGNAARAITAMACQLSPSTSPSIKPAIALSMFGVTTPCVQKAAEILEERGYTPIIFHATGAGGKSMERLISEGKFAGVLDITTTELADEHVGGVLSAGKDRLTAATKAGVPQVISLGALDMVNYGPMSTVPDSMKNRKLHEHNASVTLMRTTKKECQEIGAQMAVKLRNAQQGRLHILVPLRGVSLLDVEGGVFYDPIADRALQESLRRGLPELQDYWTELDMDINNPKFATTAVELLLSMIE